MSQSHDHEHEHEHTPAVTSANERKVLISFLMIFTFMVVEAVGGILSGSLALLADAGHMLTDAVALALAYAAFRFGRREADSKRTFGYLRFEVIAGFFNALTLFAIVAWIAYEAWERLQAPPAILAGPMLIVAIVGLLVNVLVLWIMTRGETDHVNVKGAILHVMGIYWVLLALLSPLLSFTIRAGHQLIQYSPFSSQHWFYVVPGSY